MGYYAKWNGSIEFTNYLSEEESCKVAGILNRYSRYGNVIFEPSVNRIKNVGLYGDGNYYEEIWDKDLSDLSSIGYIKKAEIDFFGEDGDLWRIYKHGSPDGFWDVSYGRIEYDDSNAVGDIISMFDSFLEEAGVKLPVSEEEKAEDGMSRGNTCRIYGTDYDTLYDRVFEILYRKDV